MFSASVKKVRVPGKLVRDSRYRIYEYFHVKITEYYFFYWFVVSAPKQEFNSCFSLASNTLIYMFAI
jgi:hypothetical protein